MQPPSFALSASPVFLIDWKEPMYTSYVLIANLDAKEDELQFEHFRLRKIQTRGDLNDAQALFGRMAHFCDWIYERDYSSIPELHLGGYGSIPWHVDDALLCFRLFKVGDIAFVAQVIKGPEDETARRYPHRIMSAMSTNVPYHFTQAECPDWDNLSEGLPSCQGNRSDAPREPYLFNPMAPPAG
jgi:hypothetical protein